jgi:hypothetical protein
MRSVTLLDEPYLVSSFHYLPSLFLKKRKAALQNTILGHLFMQKYNSFVHILLKSFLSRLRRISWPPSERPENTIILASGRDQKPKYDADKLRDTTVVAIFALRFRRITWSLCSSSRKTIELLHVQGTKSNMQALGVYLCEDGPFEGNNFDPVQISSSSSRY